MEYDSLLRMVRLVRSWIALSTLRKSEAMYMRACPVHHLSDAAPLAVPAKKKLCFLFIEPDKVTVWHTLPHLTTLPKIKQVKRCFFVVVALWDVT